MAKRVIDADGHICEPPTLWNEYVEKRYRADTIRVERDPDGRDWMSINGTIRRNLRPAAACVPWGMDDPDKVPTWDDILPGSYDGGARVRVLDEEGIDYPHYDCTIRARCRTSRSTSLPCWTRWPTA